MSKAKTVAVVKEKIEDGYDKYNRPIFNFKEVAKIDIFLSTEEIELVKDGLVYTDKKSIGLTSYKLLNDKQILIIAEKDYKIETVDNSTRLSIIELSEVI